MELIDIGVNLTNKRLRYDVEQILEEAHQQHVTQLIITGTSMEHSQMAIDLCNTYPEQLLSTAGVHPHDAKLWMENSPVELVNLAKQNCVRAIGECGLDFNRNFSPRDQQVDVFQQQLEIARQIQKPVFLHQRDAMDTFVTLLKEYRDQLNAVVVHCFTDDKQALYQLLDLDCHIGITGWICDERRGQELQSSVKDIPPDRLMLETDAPYLLPRDLPQKPANHTNYPKYLPHILNTVAYHQGKAIEVLADEVLNTTRHFFNL
ncbi:MAG: TatD family hydrolase [Gammaproteobacteria bacterium]|nr:TatD family hydrolase [Gammaproteobacteria bacterium]